jgi:carboxylesterase
MMAVDKILPGSEPVFIKGSEIGILLLHGFTGSPYEMKELGIYLSSKSYTISIPLLKGHGTSPKDLNKCTWYDWFEDAKQALFDLRKSCKTIIVAGLSTGATLALHLAAHYQVEAVAAFSPALFLKQKLTRILPYFPLIYPYSNKKNGPDIFDEQARAKAITYNKIPLKAVRQALELYAHLKMDLPEIYVPTLIIQAEKDHVVQMKSAQWIYDHISSKEKQFLKLQKSYHVITLDIEKKIVFRETAQFIEKQL